MNNFVALNWWALALRGMFAIFFGLVAFFMPVVTLWSLTILFGAYALIDGVVSLIAAIRSARQGAHWWALLFEGIVGLAAAFVTVVWPAVTLVILIYIVAAWALITGIAEIVAAIHLRRHVPGEWLLALVGVASVVFGVLLFAAPGPGAIVLAWWLGAYIFAFGVLMLILAFRLRHHAGASGSSPLHPQHV